MSTDRRSFLRLFGASTAAVATVEGIETVSSPTAPAEFAADTRFGNLQDRLDRSDWKRNGRAFDVRPHIFYHRIDIEKNAMRGSYGGFSVSLGTPMPDGSNADMSVTNMQRPNSLPMPNAFLLRKLGVVFSPKTEPGLRSSAFLDRYVMSFRLDQKEYWKSPLSFMFSLAGEPERSERGENPSLFATLPDKGLADVGEVPLVISDEVCFTAEVYGNPIQPCGRLRFWIVGEGLYARAVQ